MSRTGSQSRREETWRALRKCGGEPGSGDEEDGDGSKQGDDAAAGQGERADPRREREKDGEAALHPFGSSHSIESSAVGSG